MRALIATCVLSMITACHAKESPPAPAACGNGVAASDDEVKAWKTAGSPNVSVAAIEHGARVTELVGDRVCRVDCRAPHLLVWKKDVAGVACEDRPAVAANEQHKTELSTARRAHDGTSEMFKDPPCAGDDDGDDSSNPQPSPVPPLFGIETNFGLDVTENVRQAGRDLLGGDPTVVSIGGQGGGAPGFGGHTGIINTSDLDRLITTAISCAVEAGHFTGPCTSLKRARTCWAGSTPGPRARGEIARGGERRWEDQDRTREPEQS